MIGKIGKLVALAGAAEAVRRYLRNNPDQVNQIATQAGHFVDQRTNGKYHDQIGEAVRKVRDATAPPVQQ